ADMEGRRMGIRLSYEHCRKQDRGQGQRNRANQHLAWAFHDPTGTARYGPSRSAGSPACQPDLRAARAPTSPDPWSQRFGLYVGERTNFRNRTTFIASGRSYLCHSKRCAALIASAITRSEFTRHEMHAELWRATPHSAYPKNNLIRLVQNNRKDISKPL